MSKENCTQKKTPKTVSVSIPKGFEDEVAYLGKQPNKSQYIWNLIREDMQNITLGGVVNNNSKQKQKVNNFQEDKRKKGAMSILQD